MTQPNRNIQTHPPTFDVSSMVGASSGEIMAKPGAGRAVLVDKASEMASRLGFEFGGIIVRVEMRAY